MNTSFLQFSVEIIFLSIIFLHLAKKNIWAVIAYGVQSLAIVAVLANYYFATGNVSLLIIALLAIIIKVILAPAFFIRLIKKHNLKFLVSTYLNTPLTLLVLAALTALAYSNKFSPITNIIPENHALLSLALGAMLLSLFLIVNRKGALSQIIGILSLENSLVAFAIFAGREQSLGLQIGIIFDIFVWLIIATVFVSMIFSYFGSLDVTSMKHLKD